MAEEEEEDKAIKVILLGESGVGKTNLIRVAMGNPFDESSHSTISSSYYDSEIIINNKQYTYCLWDTAGQEAYRSLNQMFVKESKIVLIVFSIDNKKSFDEVDFWFNYVKDILGSDNYIVALIANKSDLFEKQTVPDDVIQKKADDLKIKVKITSAAEDAVGFKSFLSQLLEEYINNLLPKELQKPKTFKVQEEKNDNTGNNNNNNNSKQKNKKKCC